MPMLSVHHGEDGNVPIVVGMSSRAPYLIAPRR